MMIHLRNILILIMAFFLQGYMLQGNPLDSTTDQKKKMLLMEAISLISQQYNVYFTFDHALVSDITVEYETQENLSVEDAISGVLNGTNLKFKLYDRRFVILYQNDEKGLESLKEMVKHFEHIIADGPEEKVTRRNFEPVKVTPLSDAWIPPVRKLEKPVLNVSGTVTDQAGEPLIGVNVQVKGTNKGTATDVDGRYELDDVNENAILVFSYIGYVTLEVPIDGRSTVDVAMLIDAQMLDEVVVVGYGTQKKVNLTGAVSTVDSKVLSDRPIVTIADGLKGTIPNLNITQATGSPGLAQSFNIRGTTSITGGSPLILVDGVPKEINLINPSDIESISVLKDGASAAIYGARAAYGVILISTKKGKDGKPRISLNMNSSMNSPTTWLETMDSYNHMTYLNAASQMVRGRDYFDEYQSAGIIDHYNDPSKPKVIWNPLSSTNTYNIYDMVANTDWPREFLRETFPQHQLSASVSGGTDKLNYYNSFSYLDQTGMAKNFDEKYIRYNYTLNLDYDVSKWLNVGSKVSINKSKKDYPASEQRITYWTSEENLQFHYALWPEFPPYITSPEGKRLYLDLDGVSNPVQQQLEGGYRQREISDIWLTGLAKINPFKHTTINLDYSANINYIEGLSYISNQPFYDRDGNVAGLYFASDPNSVERSYGKSIYNVLNAYLEYENVFAGKYYLKYLVGFNQEDFTINSFTGDRQNLIINQIPYLSLATGIQNVSDEKNSYAVRGAFSRINFNLDEKYFLELNGRYDGSSKFPKDDRFDFFPSLSIGWRIENESFFENLRGHINLFKIRASYGNLGNQDVSGYYPYISTYGVGRASYTFGGELPVTAFASGLVSSDLTWETVTQKNLGLDFGFLDYRLTGSFDIYQRDTRGMLTLSEKLPAVLAVGEPRTNAADLKTTGFELTIGWKDEIGDVSYGANFILSDYTAKITKYSNPQGVISNYYVGSQIGDIWGFVTGGIFQSDEEAEAYLDQTQISGRVRQAGDLWFEDLNGDGKITFGSGTLDDPGDRKIIGNETPRYSFGFSPNISWKGFDFSILMEGVLKRDRIVSNRFFMSQYLDQWEMLPEIGMDYWTPDNRDAYFPRPTLFEDTGDIRQVQTRFMQDASYLRLRNLTFAYTIPRQWTQQAGIENVKVYFTGHNLMTWTDMIQIIDPELNGAYVYPIHKSISMGLNVNL